MYNEAPGREGLTVVLCVSSRLHHLESKVTEDVGKTPDIICELKSQVESFKRKLEVRPSVVLTRPSKLLSERNLDPVFPLERGAPELDGSVQG